MCCLHGVEPYVARQLAVASRLKPGLYLGELPLFLRVADNRKLDPTETTPVVIYRNMG